MKVRSVDELQVKLDHDLESRKREITTVKFLLSESRRHQKLPCYKAAVILLYSHWEGFVKHAARCYLEYIRGKGYKYSDLKDSFRFFLINSTCENTGKFNFYNYDNYQSLTQVVDTLESHIFDCDPQTFIETREHQNLNSEEFRRLINKLSLEYFSIYELREKFLDESILGLRNPFAHGETMDKWENCSPVSYDDDFEEKARLLLEMIQSFNDQLLDAADHKKFLDDSVLTLRKDRTI